MTMRDSNSAPFPSLELNMSLLSPTPDKNGKKDLSSTSNVARNSNRDDVIDGITAIQNLKNVDSMMLHQDNGIECSNNEVHLEYGAAGISNFSNEILNQSIEETQLKRKRDLCCSLQNSNDIGRGTHDVNVETKGIVVESEFDLIMEEAAQLIGEAESCLDEMRMIQVKNAILMDSLVMTGG